MSSYTPQIRLVIKPFPWDPHPPTSAPCRPPWSRRSTVSALQVTAVEPGDFSPPLATPDVFVPFEREVNILALHSADLPEADSVLGSENAQGLALESGFIEGWGRFSFSETAYQLHGSRYEDWVVTDSTVEGDGVGVPLFGFMASRSGLSGENIGETFPHFFNRDR